MSGKDQVLKAQTFSNISMRVPPRLAQRICVWFSMKCGDPPAITLRKIQMCFKQLSYSKATVCHWHKDFANGRTKVGDLFRGSNWSARTDANIQKCAAALGSSRRKTINQVRAEASLSYGTTLRILHRDLELTKCTAKFVPHQLTDRDKRLRLDFCKKLVAEHERDPRCLDWLVTTDESWFYQYDPRFRYQNKEWLQKDEDRGQVVMCEMNVKKVMFVPFFDRRGLVHWEYFVNQNINKHVFHGIIQRAHQSVRRRRGLEVWRNREEYLLHMDNAPAHRSILVQGLLQQTHWNTMKHPPYSPDLSPADFFLFPYLKRRLQGVHYESIAALVISIEDELGQITSQQWTDCFDDWIRRSKRCIEFQGQYFEGMKNVP